MNRSPRLSIGLAFVVILAASSGAAPVGTAFTYQGRLEDGGAPANGIYDLEFALYDAATAGAQVGSTVRKDNVPVANGLFVVALDFGSAAFAGEARWLQIGVRPDASSDPFTPLASRQELTPTPNAIHSQSAAATPWSGLTGVPGGFADGVDNDSGGTVMSVATGAGLTGGPVTSTGTIAIADGGVTSGMIATGAVGLSQIDKSQVQARVAATCTSGQFFQGINADGTVLCGSIFNPPTITTVDDPANSVGRYPSIAIGTDGLPVVSYLDQTAGALMIVHCGDAACSSGNTITTVDDPANSVGWFTSIAIGTDGLPVVSYYDGNAGVLKVAHCGDATCSSGSTITTVDDPGQSVGGYSSIAVGADGLPVISYQDLYAAALKVAKCVNADCTGTSTITTVDDPANEVGLYTSIAIGTDGLPVISYFDNDYDDANGALKVAKCVNADCTGTSTITTVDDPANDVGPGTSIAIGTDGLPVISYVDASAGALKVTHCGNAACSSGNTMTTVDNPAESGVAMNLGTSIAIGTDGYPVISYGVYDSSAAALKVLKCGNATCRSGNTITTVDNPIDERVGGLSAIAIGSDGLPVISYWDQTAGALKVAKCHTPTCRWLW